ncbi:MAG: hypothetical protein EOO77_14745 [Oxalobacteraceae bacterium]|nr:MAG: hypothetical protein EOO77_14745 [Oxalobacteraceae bacterium]
MNNIEMIEALRQIKVACDADTHGGMLHFTRMKMIEMGFFECMPESALDPFRPCPSDWTAFQIAIFDNGVPVKPKRKRSYIERTKVQYGGQIKVWTRQEINFRQKSQVAWKANIYLWDASTAVQVADELLAQSYIDQETVDLMKQMVSGCGTGYMFAIPVLRTKEAGSRWMKGHVVAIEMNSGKPGTMMMYGPDMQIGGRVWSEQSADGRDLSDNVVCQMRLGANSGFDAWATQPAA